MRGAFCLLGPTRGGDEGKGYRGKTAMHTTTQGDFSLFFCPQGCRQQQSGRLAKRHGARLGLLAEEKAQRKAGTRARPPGRACRLTKKPTAGWHEGTAARLGLKAEEEAQRKAGKGAQPPGWVAG